MDAHAEHAQERGAQGRKLRHGRGVHLDASDVGDQLQQERVPDRAPVGAQLDERRSGLQGHRVEDVPDLVCDGFERCAGKVRPGAMLREAANQPPRVLVPVRCTHSGEGRYEIDTAVVDEIAREMLRFLAAPQQLELIPEPRDVAPVQLMIPSKA